MDDSIGELEEIQMTESFSIHNLKTSWNSRHNLKPQESLHKLTWLSRTVQGAMKTLTFLKEASPISAN